MDNNKEIEKFALPKGYDVVTEYQENVEQGIVDSLFDYFGKVYYKSDVNTQGKKVRNEYISKYDKKLLKMFASRTHNLWFVFAALLFTGVVGLTLFLTLIGTDIADGVTSLAAKLSNFDTTSPLYMFLIVFFAIIFAFIIGCLLLSIITLVSVIYWMKLDSKHSKRMKDKIQEWNRVFDSFSKSLDKNSILNAVQSSIPDLIFDKKTPSYDRKIYNIHNRVYSYSSIPQDAKRISYTNTLSGFYKGYAFSLSTSSWEWFREAKVVEEDLRESNASVHINIKRSLKRFEDNLSLLVVDTFANPKLNFVLNNPEGKNIRLQNDIFNNVFSLAVNNAKYAHNVFTPYVQHTLSRLKTWSDSSKNIRQIIKEGSKIYVIFDSDPDFFKFERVANPAYNYIFNSKNLDESSIFKDGKKVSGKDTKKSTKANAKSVKCGSLDETASLMTEYILEETDLLFSALEMATCYPADDAFINSSKENKKSKTLLNVLEEKRNKDYSKLATERINSITSDDLDLQESTMNVPDWNSDKTPTFKPIVNVDID